jgi:16S rRNA (adenine1518-N6/adenine1519-N6)-dimethyltransferase
LGQHFLNNPVIVEKIANSLTGNGYSSLLEVGPGQGVLTNFLVQKPFNLKLVELDDDLFVQLEAKYGDKCNDIIHEDFLKLNLKEVFDEPFALIGNFPYNISSQIVFSVLSYHDSIPEMIGMFQKEVAERICADEGSKKYGITSVLTSFHYHRELLFDVGPDNFDPPPKVNSAVIRLVHKENLPVISDYKSLKSMIKMAFNQRRKMLRNSLKPILQEIRLENVPFLDRRPESLSPEEFIVLHRHIQSETHGKRL